MSQEQKAQGKVLKVFRLETEAEVSVSEPGVKVQSVHADLIPLSMPLSSENESRLRSAFASAGLTPEQVGYALQELARTAKNQGFLIRIDPSRPTR
jgi:hypothetical protein